MRGHLVLCLLLAAWRTARAGAAEEQEACQAAPAEEASLLQSRLQPDPADPAPAGAPVALGGAPPLITFDGDGSDPFGDMGDIGEASTSKGDGSDPFGDMGDFGEASTSTGDGSDPLGDMGDLFDQIKGKLGGLPSGTSGEVGGLIGQAEEKMKEAQESAQKAQADGDKISDMLNDLRVCSKWPACMAAGKTATDWCCPNKDSEQDACCNEMTSTTAFAPVALGGAPPLITYDGDGSDPFGDMGGIGGASTSKGDGSDPLGDMGDLGEASTSMGDGSDPLGDMGDLFDQIKGKLGEENQDEAVPGGLGALGEENQDAEEKPVFPR